MSSVPLLIKDHEQIKESRENYWNSIDNQVKGSGFQTEKLKEKSHNEFMLELTKDSQELREKIEKDMSYLYKTFEDCAYLVQFQDDFFHNVDNNLKKAEDNSKKIKATLSKSNSTISCQQKILSCIIAALLITVLVLIVLVFIKKFFKYFI